MTIDLTVHDDNVDPSRRMVVARDTVTKRVAWIPVTQEMLNDGVDVSRCLERQFDRAFNPWKYPDRPWSWRIELFPRWARFARWLRSLRHEV